MSQNPVYPHGGVKGTGLRLSAKIFNLEIKEDVAYWFSDNGIVIGLPDRMV